MRARRKRAKKVSFFFFSLRRASVASLSSLAFSSAPRRADGWIEMLTLTRWMPAPREACCRCCFLGCTRAPRNLSARKAAGGGRRRRRGGGLKARLPFGFFFFLSLSLFSFLFSSIRSIQFGEFGLTSSSESSLAYDG